MCMGHNCVHGSPCSRFVTHMYNPNCECIMEYYAEYSNLCTFTKQSSHFDGVENTRDYDRTNEIQTLIVWNVHPWI